MAPCAEKPIDIIDTPVVVAGLISPQPDSPDPGDPFLWNLLALRPDLILVTGDRVCCQTPAWGSGSSRRWRWHHAFTTEDKDLAAAGDNFCLPRPG